MQLKHQVTLEELELARMRKLWLLDSYIKVDVQQVKSKIGGINQLKNGIYVHYY